MWLLTIRDLRYRARRFSIVIGSMAIVLTLLYLMTGLIEQFNQEPFRTTDAIGARTWVLPPGVSGPFTSSSTLSAEQVEAVDGEVEEIIVARGTLEHGGTQQEALVVGHGLGSLGSPPVDDGRASADRREAVVDRSSGVAIGDEVGVGDATFVIVGLTSDTTLLAGLPVVFVPIGSVRSALFGGAPVVSALVSSGDVEVSDGLVVLSSDEVARDALGPLEDAVASIDLIRGLLWIVAAIIVGGVLYLTALERQRDYAVLRAVGGTNRQLALGLAGQGTVLALVAVALATVLQYLIVPLFPLTVRVPVQAFWQLPLLAVVVAVLATLVGSSRVRRTDPAAAFGGP